MAVSSSVNELLGLAAGVGALAGGVLVKIGVVGAGDAVQDISRKSAKMSVNVRFMDTNFLLLQSHL